MVIYIAHLTYTTVCRQSDGTYTYLLFHIFHMPRDTPLGMNQLSEKLLFLTRNNGQSIRIV